MNTCQFRTALSAAIFGAMLCAANDASAAPRRKAPEKPDDGRIVIASWNTENLFDAEDDPDNEGDDEFLPTSWTRWTQARYELKVKHLAKAIAGMRPDAIVLTEVENFRVLDDLRSAVKDAGWEMPYIVHRDGPDKRGIDNAMLSRHDPVAVDWLSPTPFQRLVMIVTLDIDGRRLTVFGNHWKSYYGDYDAAIATRTKEARAVREEIARRLEADPAAAIICTGDFNDSWDTPILVDEAGFATNLAAFVQGDAGHVLYNLASGRNKRDVRTYYYARKNRWDSFDTMSVSRGMLAGSEVEAPWRVATDADSGAFRYEVYTTPEMRRPENGSPLPFRRIVRRTGVEVLSGYSDHFPIRVELLPSTGGAEPETPSAEEPAAPPAVEPDQPGDAPATAGE